MPMFQYVATNPQGRQIAGKLAAPTEQEVRGELRRKNLTLVNLRMVAEAAGPARPSRFTKKFWTGLVIFYLFGPIVWVIWYVMTPRVKLMDMVLFTRQLSTMISAGIPLLECLEVLTEQSENKLFKNILNTVVEDVRAGSDLSAALEKHPMAFSNIYVAMTRAGEASGQLDIILTRMAEYQEAMAKLRREILGAMTYPAVSLTLVLGITAFLMIGIVPKFKEIFDSLDVELPWITQFLMTISLFLVAWWFLGLLLFYSSIAFFLILARTDGGEKFFHAFMLRVPIFGSLFRKVALSRFSRTFSTLIKSGVPILASLEIVATTSGNRIVEDAVLQGCESVKAGETLAEPLGRFWVFPPMVVRMVSIGEKAGALEQLLEKIAEFYDQQVSAAVEGLTAMIEPILIFLMGIIVGGIVLAVFLPIFKLQETLQAH